MDAEEFHDAYHMAEFRTPAGDGHSWFGFVAMCQHWMPMTNEFYCRDCGRSGRVHRSGLCCRCAGCDYDMVAAAGSHKGMG